MIGRYIAESSLVIIGIEGRSQNTKSYGSIEIIMVSKATPESQCYMQSLMPIFKYMTKLDNDDIANYKPLAFNVVPPSQTYASSPFEQVNDCLTTTNHYHGYWAMTW